MTYANLTLSIDAGRARVVLDRPPANALSDEFIGELHQVAKELAQRRPRVVVLSSARPIFMAGADLDTLHGSWGDLGDRIAAFQTMANTWEALPFPTIALINGHALGGGCELTLACDWRIMARGPGRIGLPEVRLGLLSAGGGTQRTARLIGRAKALDITMRGLLLDADQAERAGLVSEACDPDDLEARGTALADELFRLPAHALSAIKRCVVQGLETDLQAGLALEGAEMLALSTTDDAKEGVQAFLEKRAPSFSGH